VIAYKQPVTSPEISEIRGVNTSGVISTLLDKRLITTAGRKEVIGRPILYKTSKEFLMRFGLSDLEELPSLKEFEALAREALGSDEGMAPSSSEDSREGEITVAENAASGGTEGARSAVPAAHGDSRDTTSEMMERAEQQLAEAEELREEEAAATSEGMPAGQLDEEPPAPAVKSTAAGE